MSQMRYTLDAHISAEDILAAMRNDGEFCAELLDVLSDTLHEDFMSRALADYRMDRDALAVGERMVAFAKRLDPATDREPFAPYKVEKITGMNTIHVGDPVSYQIAGMVKPEHGYVNGLATTPGMFFFRNKGEMRGKLAPFECCCWGHVDAWLVRETRGGKTGWYTKRDADK